jgi:hypothetical protein
MKLFVLLMAAAVVVGCRAIAKNQIAIARGNVRAQLRQ